jgi:hypothetical protein
VSSVDGLPLEVTSVPVKERFFDVIVLTPPGRQPRVDLEPPLVENDLPVDQEVIPNDQDGQEKKVAKRKSRAMLGW